MGKVPVLSSLSKRHYHRPLVKSIVNLTQQWSLIINFFSKNSPVVQSLYQHMLDSLESQQSWDTRNLAMSSFSQLSGDEELSSPLCVLNWGHNLSPLCLGTGLTQYYAVFMELTKLTNVTCFPHFLLFRKGYNLWKIGVNAEKITDRRLREKTTWPVNSTPKVTYYGVRNLLRYLLWRARIACNNVTSVTTDDCNECHPVTQTY